ncbi:hypothetical protein [Chryseobacterium jejuense]|uniref:RHS Repeat n=1 Tax=Chryseobacterium jejuense TaxID=445960 RepID=A0A2X2VSB5_CHRJE|nr:hypothetical protein [Chryseobacterium jejuense]SDJ18438.1 hypothetical protein SAMN05421542_2937 [Chryseobacterium jejuense]SQB28193.1 Uncharacterised protein [Chryseobacterium jejuense]
MKNYLFLGMMGAALFFNSCSNNDDNINEATETKLFLKKAVINYYDSPYEPESITDEFEYNTKGELVKMWTNGKLSTIEYNNDRPTKVNYYTNENKLEYYSNLYYTGNQLNQVKSMYVNMHPIGTLNYAYNSEGQLISSTNCQSVECTKPDTETLTYKGDNVSTHIMAITSGINFSIKSEYSYDNKLNPYTNINKYLKIMMGDVNPLNKNNYTVIKNSNKWNNGNWELSENTTYTYEYNSSGFPVKVVGTNSKGNIAVQYNYEYITL